MGDLAELEERLGHVFADPELLRTALTHRSRAHEAGEDAHYERLEFLGDAVLGLVTAEWLYATLEEEPEGELAKLKSYLVSAPVLARHAGRLGLGTLLRLGVGEERSGGRTKESLLADTMEAVLGALYLDSGLDAARRVVMPMLERGMARHARIRAADAKTTLQERLQAEGRELPDYQVAAATGPDHRKQFTVDCVIDGRVAGSGCGPSKKKAEQAAAAVALAALQAEERGAPAESGKDRGEGPPRAS
jgi:ribonuclease-3